VVDSFLPMKRVMNGTSNPVGVMCKRQAWKLLAAHNPRIAVLHGVEHVVSLFCKDVAKLTPIHIVVLKDTVFLYQSFGSGSMHNQGPYAVFTKHVSKSLIIDIRLAYSIRQIHIWWDTILYIALYHLLWLQKSLQSAPASFEWSKYTFVSKNKQ
jgi:hypothetical protein